MNHLSVKLLLSVLFVVLLYAAIFRVFGVRIGSENIKRTDYKSTDLYFTDHTTLPKKVAINKNYTFEFTTKNLENATSDYTYVVVLSSDNLNTNIASGNFQLQNNEEKKVPVNFSILQSFGRAKVTVVLEGKNQQIHFWVEEES